MARVAEETPLEPGHVVVEGLWERFRIYHSRPRGIKDRLFKLERAVYEDFWALKGVGFELEPGESFAVVGSNGSGKSTLLKCLAGILVPDRGEVRVGGKVASLLELGAGFHGDLTGRENIYLNGSILGLGRKDIDAAFDQIVEFAGVREFIDTPVRNYSSGMYVRLGFAVAINVDPDVLLIDEVLAVGDAAFQAKCFEKMNEFRRRGKTFVLVTHSLDAAVQVCDRAILLDHGEVVSRGTARSVVDAYRQRIMAVQAHEEEAQAQEPAPAEAPRKRWGTGGAAILDVSLLDEAGHAVQSVSPGQPATLRMPVRFDETAEEPIFGVIATADDGTMLFNTNSMWRGIKTGTFQAGDVVEVRFVLRVNLLPGRYVVTLAVAHQDANQWYEWWDECLTFHVRGVDGDKGHVDMRCTVEILSLSSERQA